MSKKLSIKELAKLAGVSTATVSRILNEKGGYSSETEEKVLRIVKETGFSINVAAKALRTNISKSIGVVVPDITNEFFSRIVRQISLYFLAYNYSVFVCDSNESLEIEKKYISELQSRNIDGIIYVQGQNNNGLEDMDLKIPVVYIDRSPVNADVVIESDNFLGGVIVADELLRLGCKNLIAIRDIHNLSSINDRIEGFISRLREENVESKIFYIDNPTVEDGKIKMQEIIDSGYKFDGVFASNDIVSIGVYNTLKNNGIAVPKDVKLIGFDGNELIKSCFDFLLTIDQDVEKMAVEGCKILYEMMTEDISIKTRIKIPVSLNRGRGESNGTFN
ncbi:transcriptional regulator, LacI family [Anaerosphaera aminiphila DSM 21120]|uniref:Transcriptional regulator, LacI family n=1 Tax=Anaerosphaera aminiphila DSM 21120 TaxID=1120995 RepID=A0A1M5TS39_9FIRM|nr:LacI family DNA-binding transcriptional regulator [Anaerosphaera aminiphila]SHH53592.1 transcriptional regulator, LacI family [Anaerosphaera aminiphila DSM 21120]